MFQIFVVDIFCEYLFFLELFDDVYWEVGIIYYKDMLYDIISIFSQEVVEINKFSIQDYYYFYEVIIEGICWVVFKLE